MDEIVRNRYPSDLTRPLAVDPLGLLLAIVVTSAAVDDAAAAPLVLRQLERCSFARLYRVAA